MINNITLLNPKPGDLLEYRKELFVYLEFNDKNCTHI